MSDIAKLVVKYAEEANKEHLALHKRCSSLEDDVRTYKGRYNMYACLKCDAEFDGGNYEHCSGLGCGIAYCTFCWDYNFDQTMHLQCYNCGGRYCDDCKWKKYTEKCKNCNGALDDKKGGRHIYCEDCWEKCCRSCYRRLCTECYGDSEDKIIYCNSCLMAEK